MIKQQQGCDNFDIYQLYKGLFYLFLFSKFNYQTPQMIKQPPICKNMICSNSALSRQAIIGRWSGMGGLSRTNQ